MNETSIFPQGDKYAKCPHARPIENFSVCLAQKIYEGGQNGAFRRIEFTMNKNIYSRGELYEKTNK